MSGDDHAEVLERKLAAMFPDPSRREEVIRLLGEYGRDEHEHEPDRVRLAILKLAGGNISKIGQSVATAKKDYRDILAYAEYPNQMGRDSWKLTDAENKILIDADREQYEKWKR